MGAGNSSVGHLVRNLIMKMEYKDIIGKTIASVTEMKKPQFDDEGWLRLEFTDGTVCAIVASYGGYTGKSEDENPTCIGITCQLDGLIPVAKRN